jgi:hypothetical protein
MPGASGTIVYATLRAIVALAVVFSAWHGGRQALPIIGQAVADAACLAFLLAYADYDLRASLGWFALPLLLYVMGWEGWGALRAAETDPGSDSAADGVGAELLGWLGGYWRVVYRLLLVVPPVGAGAFLVLALLYPGSWAFPSMPAPLRCTPETVARGDTLTLHFTGSHGGELGVFTPADGFLYIVDFAPTTAPPSAHFEYRARFALPTATASGRVLQAAPPGYPEVPVFTDTGTYLFRVSDVAELSASLTCRVRYVGERGVSATRRLPQP